MNLSLKHLIPLLILFVVLIIKNIKTNKLNNTQNIENFQNNVIPTTIDYRTINIKQGNSDGSYLLLGKFSSTKTNLSFYLDVLPNEHFNGRTQFGLSLSNKSKSCFHELVFGMPSFGNLMLILRQSDWHIVLKKIAPDDNIKYKVSMPCILTTSGDLNTSEFLNMNNEGTSVLDTFIPTEQELKDAIISVQNTDRYKALINQTLENNGLKIEDNKIELSKSLNVNGDLTCSTFGTREHASIGGTLDVNHGVRCGNTLWVKYGIEVPEGGIWVRDIVDSSGLKFNRERLDHINVDGALYRYNGQVHLTNDDNIILRDYTNNNQWNINNKGHLDFRNYASNSSNFTIHKNGGLETKTFNGGGGAHLHNTLHWHR